MSVQWKKLKSEINELVEALKAKVQNEFKAEYEKKDISVSVKYKDNAKSVAVKILNKNKPESDSGLEITLENSSNLTKRFDSAFAEFKKQN